VVSLTELRLRAVRARMADVVTTCAAPPAMGSVTLQPHQQLAVSRVAQMMARHGGCLLADDVGRGKTYVALAVARRWTRPLVVLPASLRTTWQLAMRRAGSDCTMITHEALSRGSLPSCEPDVVIVDESHHFRSPDSKRHACLAAITAHVPVLLLSATPLQNRTRDLAAQLALFLGSAAFRRDDAALARFVVRGGAAGEGGVVPLVAPPRWLHTGHDDSTVLNAILALPPPARTLDAGDAGALRTIGLVRAWASSRAALLARVRRRMQAVTALEQCAASGLAPTRRELRAWYGADGNVQLAFAPLLVAAPANDADLVSAVNAERAALDRLHAALRDSPDPDPARVAALRRLRTEHPRVRILAFSEFASTVRAFFRLLAADPGVGMLTASEARIASGRLSRDQLLDRFAPASRGARDPVPREQVTLLLTTDLLSEGVNLQDAGIVVHLDLPWNPARLAQRVGRVRRPGGALLVRSCLMSPPASSELLLRVEARLRAKLARAERTIGPMLHVMPTLAPPEKAEAEQHDLLNGDVATNVPNAEAQGAIAERVASWRRSRWCDRCRGNEPLVAAVKCRNEGWLAALSDGRLVARVGSSAPDANVAVGRAVEMACSRARACRDDERAAALGEAAGWLERERLTLDCGVHDGTSTLDAVLERRIAGVLARVPRHQRVRLLALATRLRGGLGRPRPLGAERELEMLLAMHSERRIVDAEWLARSVGVIDRIPARARDAEPPRVVALVVFGPVSGA
jgi:superfamily II DNA or RNA helicase